MSFSVPKHMKNKGVVRHFNPRVLFYLFMLFISTHILLVNIYFNMSTSTGLYAADITNAAQERSFNSRRHQIHVSW